MKLTDAHLRQISAICQESAERLIYRSETLYAAAANAHGAGNSELGASLTEMANALTDIAAVFTVAASRLLGELAPTGAGPSAAEP